MWRWMQKPKFQAEYRCARRQVVEHALSQLQAITSEAVDTLRRNITCGTATAEIRAAQIIIEQAIKGIELTELQDRIEQLESKLNS